MQGDFYIEVRQRLRTLVPGIKFFDVYRGQFEPNDNGNAMPTHRPCVLIEFGDERTSHVGQKTVRVDQPFNLYVVTDTVKEWSAEQDDTNAAAEINAHSNLCAAIKNALINYRGGETGFSFNTGVIRNGGKPLMVRGPYIISVIGFAVGLSDYSATPDATKTITAFPLTTTVTT